MTAFMDFGMLTPEINSGRMYAGAGSAPLLTAAAAWTGLAADLRSTSADYSSTVAGLTSAGWQGPASTSMAAAASSYTAWLNTTAAQAEETATKATAAAGAYETARAATVPPPVVAANRAQLASLVATNILGQNTPAIATTEAEYGQMWAQDAAAMYGYAGSSAAATNVTPFTAPQPTTNPGGLAGQAATLTQATGTSASTNTQTVLSQLTSAVPSTLQGMASPAAASTAGAAASTTASPSGLLSMLLGGSSGSTQLDSFWNEWGPDANIWNTIFSSGFYTPGNTIGAFMGLLGSGGGAEAAGAAAENSALRELGAGLGAPLTGPLSGLGGVGGLGGLGNGVSAGLGRAAALGPLSVPPSWTPVAPAASPIGTALGGTPLSGPAGVSTMPGGVAPAAGVAGRTTGQISLPDTRFLDRPPMVPSWAAVG